MIDNRKIKILAIGATILAFIVVVLGAYTRLTDAGLGCPDWPGCYGQLIPDSMSTKAWTEMIHRYVAGSLGLVIFILAFFILKNRFLFKNQSILLAIAVSILVVFQALLGMWTVTLKLFPSVVVAHLLGGLTTLSLLWWLSLNLNQKEIVKQNTIDAKLRFWATIGLVVIVMQIFLGGWTSANYAALVCLDFPFCNSLHKTFEIKNFLEAFNFTAAGVDGSFGAPLNHDARVTIHMLHRIGAIFTTLILGWLVLLSWTRSKNFKIRTFSIIILSLLLIQIVLGITNVLAVLPLLIAVAHNAVAALLLLSLVSLNYFIYESKSS